MSSKALGTVGTYDIAARQMILIARDIIVFPELIAVHCAIFTDYEDVKGDAKWQKWGGLK